MSALVLMLALLVGDTFRTEIIFLGELPAARAMVLHDRLMGQDGESSIVLGRQPNMIVVKDTTARLKRFRELLAILDRPGAAEMHIYIRPVQHLSPSELVALTQDILEPKAASKVRLVPDDRSRQLLIMCLPETYRTLDKLLRRLDVAASGPKRDVRVTPSPDGGFPP